MPSEVLALIGAEPLVLCSRYLGTVLVVSRVTHDGAGVVKATASKRMMPPQNAKPSMRQMIESLCLRRCLMTCTAPLGG